MNYIGEPGQPLSIQQIKFMIESFLKCTGQNSIFPNNIPGDHWVTGFWKSCVKELSLPEPCDYYQSKKMHAERLDNYFQMYEKLLDDLGIKEMPERINNLEETVHL